MSRRRHVQHLLSAYIDGDLSPAKMRAVEAHLAACPACAWELEQWRGILRLVSYHAAVTCPIDCSEAVLQRIEARCALSTPAPFSPRPPFMPRLVLTVSLGALLGGSLWLGVTRGAWHVAPRPPARIAAGALGRRAVSWISAQPVAPSAAGRRAEETAEGPSTGTTAVPVEYGPTPDQALRVHAPDRLQQALGRSDSLILAADFTEEDR